MSDKPTELDLPVFRDVLAQLSDDDARNLVAWAAARPSTKDVAPNQQNDALVGLTATVCSALSESAPDNQQLQDALKIIATEVLTRRSPVFLPPDQPNPKRGPAVPPPKSFVFLPPDPPKRGTHGQVGHASTGRSPEDAD